MPTTGRRRFVLPGRPGPIVRACFFFIVTYTHNIIINVWDFFISTRTAPAYTLPFYSPYRLLYTVGDRIGMTTKKKTFVAADKSIISSYIIIIIIVTYKVVREKKGRVYVCVCIIII